jgi:hypothetical protein
MSEGHSGGPGRHGGDSSSSPTQPGGCNLSDRQFCFRLERSPVNNTDPVDICRPAAGKNRQQVRSPPWDAKMNRPILILFCVLSVGVYQPGSIRAADYAPSGQLDLASEVRDVFAAKCAGCHGSDLAKPKGRFGYVLDLARVASNPEMVVPFRPSESELWELLRHGEMPPADAPTGALTEQQKEVVRHWIDSGAPVVPYQPPPDTSPSITRPHEGTAGEPLSMPFGKRILRWLGKFHVLTIDFPIALFLAASIGEMWSMWRGARNPSSSVRFCALLGGGGRRLGRSPRVAARGLWRLRRRLRPGPRITPLDRHGRGPLGAGDRPVF